MANPAPTINQINAFNATQGTTIDFNIIGGTELVRSNKIYIYDLSDNSLICTHLYVSTESIHELPPNTDGSIVYESGKSSADFVNGAQYYAQIQTFTDIAGTQGGSGLSVAKMFWCLVDPTLTITTIPSTISTTSYNVSATYNANTSVVSNIIQQYQFSLYSATGSLLQSSGVVVGSGTQQGTSTTYDISYNFTGLSVGSSYYVVVDVTTTQGMGVSTQSNTFTVSIETPTLGEATVVNNACDGYISVTSNLSGEYGGSASGKIVTFETDSVNDVSSLKVTLTPQQDGTPWIGTDHDTTPYLNRAMPTQSNDYNRESGVIVGGTVAWNQLINHGNFDSLSGWINPSGGVSSTSIANNIATITANATAIQEYSYAIIKTLQSYAQGHRLLFTFDAKTPKSGKIKVDSNTAFNPIVTEWNVTANQWKTFSLVGTGAGVSAKNIYIFPKALTDGYEVGDDWQIKNVMCIDLTAMFGTTIADYIYSLEQATAGAGVAWFKKYFPEDYYPYSANTLQSVQATAHKTYDGDGNVIGNYALDSSLTLRGIPKLDASNNLYYDGDTYASDGTVTRKYGVVDMGTLNWTMASNGRMSVPLQGAALTPTSNTIANVVCVKYMADTPANVYAVRNDKAITLSNSASYVWAYDSAYTDAASFKTAMSGVYLLYELATPTTETATAYTNPQVVDPDGTEEYVTANSVPVGHDSTYSLECPISGYDEVSANVVGKNMCDNADSLLDLGTGVTYSEENGYYFPRHYDTGASHPIFVNEDGLEGQMTLSFKQKQSTTGQVKGYLYFTYTDGTYGRPTIYPTTANAWFDYSVTSDASKTVANARYGYSSSGGDSWVKDIQIEEGTTATTYEPYQGQTYTTQLGQTVYGGTVDLVSGVLTVTYAEVDLGTMNWAYKSSGTVVAPYFYTNARTLGIKRRGTFQTTVHNIICSKYATVKRDGTVFVDGTICADGDVNAVTEVQIKDSAYGTDATAFKASLNGVQLCYELATPQTIQLTPQEIQTLLGTNNVWSDSGDVEITYNIPITNLLVKRQDVGDVSGDWLTLYSQSITQASDMDFTFIDFLNQYGKTYKYALVPLLTQTQSGVEVEVEGGYTVSDEVQSIFDGVFISDSTGSQKCKANVGYGNVNMNQSVGSITPIGSQYPIIVTNSNNRYHNGSISGMIVPDDYYYNGNLSRIDMVNKRNELEQFLTNKRAKIIKDWNSNIWLVMIMDNIDCSFDNNYGMGIVTFNANWLEIGDPTNQEDLQATGLVDVGGV